MTDFDLIWTDEEKHEAEKEAYNQALNDVFERVREHYKFFKTMPSITVFEEMLEDLKGD